MKLSEAIQRVDRSERNHSYADAEKFSQEFGFHLNWNAKFEERVHGYWLWRWQCTDTWVGYRVYFMDNEPVAVSWQPARKSSEEIEWVSKEAYNKVRDFMLELLAEDLHAQPKFAKLDEVLPELGYNVTYGSQLHFYEGKLADGTPVSVVNVYGKRYEPPSEHWSTVDVKLPDGTVREKVPLSEIYFPLLLAKEEAAPEAAAPKTSGPAAV